MQFGFVEELESFPIRLSDMKSVPPRGSRWVVDSEFVTADISHSATEIVGVRRNPPATARWY